MAHRQALKRLLFYTSRSPVRSLTVFPSNISTCVRWQNSAKRLCPTLTASFHTSVVSRNEHVINIQDEEDFKKRVLANATPVVVDFHASWCGPCKLLGPRLESLIAGKEGKVILVKVDVDDLGEIAMDHQVEAVPTVLAVKDGKVVDKFVGLKDDADLENFVDKLIGA